MTSQHSHSRPEWIRAGVIAAVIAACAGGLAYWMVASSRVYIDTATIQAPLINLAPSQPGTLQEVYVQEGDVVNSDTVVARVGNELVKSKVAGIIVSVPETIGSQVNPNQPVATMIDPTQLRVVGKIDEDKGLNLIGVGERVEFTVDTFGSKTYTGVVDEVSPTSNQTGIVFNISDKRAVQQFNIKARFDYAAYPELKNGMSARMWIYQK